LGVIEEYLIFGRRRLDDTSRRDYEEHESFNEPVSDLREVYEPIRDGYSYVPIGGRFVGPNAPLPDAYKDLRNRLRRMRRYEREREEQRVLGVKAQARWPLLDALTARVAGYCQGRIRPDELSESLGDISACLKEFDLIVLEGNKTLSESQLESLAAAATYEFVAGLTQEQVAGSADSIFPSVTRPTLIRWRSYVCKLRL